MSPGSTGLAPDQVDRVLERLGLGERPSPDLDGLSLVYGRWCRRVPFDNVLKRVALVEGHEGPLPGDDPSEFFESWLRHGTGGTCWAGNGALHALLEELGFEARRGVGTMLHRADLDLPPNHGTVTVRVGEGRFLVDASLLHEQPLELTPDQETAVTHGAWGVRARWTDGTAYLRWHPLRVEEMDCRIESLESGKGEFHTYHESARTRSGFNFQFTARLLTGPDLQGAVLGDWMVRRASGAQERAPLQGAARMEFMTGVLGMSEEIAARLPPDDPIPEALRSDER